LGALRKLTLLDATLMVMGGIVGVGIFFTPQSVAERTVVPWAFLGVWLFGGLIALCAAFTFAELGATFPRSGGWFVFLREAFGPLPAFLFAWVVLFVISTGAMATIMDFCAGMLHEALPALLPAPGTVGIRFVGAGLFLGLTAITATGVKSGAAFQNACMAIKLVAIAGLILAGLVFFQPEEAAGAVAAGAAAAAEAAPGRGGSPWTGMLAALLPVFFSYGGWQLVCYISSEVEQPERILPRALLFGVGGVIVVYLLANLAFVTVLGMDGLGADPAFASTLARRSVGPTGARLLSAGMAVSALGICAVNVIATPWLYVAMAKERLFFAAFGRLHPRTGVPMAALATQAVLVLAYYLAAERDFLVDSVVFVEWIFHGLVAIALLRLRWMRPELPRPFRSFAYPLCPLVYFAAAAIVFVNTVWTAAPERKFTGLGILAVGLVVYGPWRRMVRSGEAPG